MSKVWDVPYKKLIEQALTKTIADKDVKAYVTSDELQQFIATQADPEKIDLYWFYITEQGKLRLRRLEEEKKKAGTYMDGWEPIL